LAFEEVTGEDLNWFFNQWFFSAGHPSLSIMYLYDEVNKEETVTIYQTQDTPKSPIYKLPIAIDIYANGKMERHNVVLDKGEQFYSFPVSSKPDLVNVDAKKILLATKQDDKKQKEWIFQYYNAPLYMDRYEAIYILGEQMGIDSVSEKVVLSALKDKFWYIRGLAVKYSTSLFSTHKEEIKNLLSDIALHDAKAEVRMSAVVQLQNLFPNDSILHSVYQKAFRDKSYNVSREALAALTAIDSTEGLNRAKEMENEGDLFNDVSIAYVYSLYADSSSYTFFEKSIQRSPDHSEQINLLIYYGDFLKRYVNNGNILDKGITTLADVAKNESTWWVKLYGYYAISDIKIQIQQEEKLLETYVSRLKKNKKNDEAEMTKASNELLKVSAQRSKISEVMATIRNTETDDRVKAYYYGDEQ
jgi:aminopeptidase N